MNDEMVKYVAESFKTWASYCKTVGDESAHIVRWMRTYEPCLLDFFIESKCLTPAFGDPERSDLMYWNQTGIDLLRTHGLWKILADGACDVKANAGEKPAAEICAERGHIDDGGMFFMTCKRCGWIDFT